MKQNKETMEFNKKIYIPGSEADKEKTLSCMKGQTHTDEWSKRKAEQRRFLKKEGMYRIVTAKSKIIFFFH